MTRAYEIGERRLVQVCRGKIIGLPNRQKPIYESGGNHHISETKRRKEGLTEGSDVNHTGAGIESLHGRDRHAFIAVLAVIVVLDNPGAATMPPFEQRKPARDTHGGAERILMRRCDVGYARVSAKLDASRNIQSLAVNRDWNEPATGKHQSVPQKYVARLLDPDWGVRIEQNAGGQIQCV